jgi:signal transduction histidine kinase
MELASPPPRTGSGLRRDAVLAVGVAVLLFIGSEFAVPDDLWTQLPQAVGPLLPSPAVGVLLLAESLPLVFRTVAPLSVLAVCAVSSLGVQALREPTPLPLGVLVALYGVAVRYRPVVVLGAAAAYVAALAVGIVTGLFPITDDLFYDYLVSVVATVGLGFGVGFSQAAARLAEQRATVLAREQEVRTRAAVAQEQARIAREVHDMVAHDVSVIVAQAAAARRPLPAGAPAEGALRAIETVGRDALDGLRRLLHLLRTEPDEVLRNPQPGLDALPALLSQVREAGLPVDLVVRGTARPLPGTVETNAYRIVQEALTNSLKHAGPTRATVVLDYGHDHLAVEVSDGGDAFAHPERIAEGGGPRPEGGFGMVSMRQRAAFLGGELIAGPSVSGGFRVAARLPLNGG